jgi:hypothetical protein
VQGVMAQMSGTCWFNASINCMLLSQAMRSVMIERYHEYMDENAADAAGKERLKQKLYEYSGAKTCKRVPWQKGKDLEFMLYALIQRMVVRRDRISRTRGNVSAELARVIKSKSYGDDDTDGWYTQIGVATLVRTLFPDLPDNGMDRRCYFKKCADVAEFMMECDWVSFKGPNQTPPALTRTDAAARPRVIVVVMMREKSTEVPVHICIFGAVYTLQSGVFEFESTEGTSGHAVAGTVCESRGYLYDSNHVAIESGWYTGSFPQMYLNIMRNMRYGGIATMVYGLTS